MCGRLACGLEPEEICKSCSYVKPEDKTASKPQWQDLPNGGKTYKPSYNICPSECAPILLPGKYFDSESRVVAPMVFGLIPPWIKEGETSKYTTINCRIETMKTSKLYGNLSLKRQRCIVVCIGFYEWQRHGAAGKKPHFIHAKQPTGVAIDDPNTWESGIKLLRIAALFDKHVFKNEEPVYSFTILTKEASSSISWLHTRMPLVADTEEQLNSWLDCEQFDTDEALQCFSLCDNFMSFPVPILVNKTANKDISCIKNIETNIETKSTKTENMLTNWLQKNTKKKNNQDEDNVPEKKRKSN